MASTDTASPKTSAPSPMERLIRKQDSRWVSFRVQFLSIFVFFALWQIGARNLNPILMPTPWLVVQAFGDLLSRGVLQEAFMTSLQDLAYGYFLAVVTGLALGIVVGRFVTAERIFSPFITFFMATPTIALVPLIIIWFGFGLTARVFLIAIVATWPVTINSAMGIKVLSRLLREVGWAFRLSEPQFIRWVALPNAVPYILAGLRVALGRAVVAMIVAQMTMELTGLGGLVMIYGNAFKTAHLIAGVFTSAVFAVFLSSVMDIIRDRFFPWIKGISA